MASTAYRELQRTSPRQALREGAEDGEAAAECRSRLCRARYRMLLQTALALTCTVLFYLSLSYLLGPALIPFRSQTAELFLLFIGVPLLIVEWTNWSQVRRGIAELGIVGNLGKTELAKVKTELANVTARRIATIDELRNSKPYIDVMHSQIGDSLAESEREVVEVIEQISLLNVKANKQSEHIAESIHKCLAEHL